MQQNEDENIRRWLLENRKVGFELLVRTYLKKLYGRALRTLGNEKDAEDAIQQLWLKAFISLQGFTTERILTLKIENWLQTIETSVLADFYGKKANQPPMLSIQRDLLGEKPGLTLPLIGDHDVEQIRVQNEFREQLLQAIALLPEKARTVVFLHYIQQYKEAEIARMLHIPVNTVKSYIRRTKPVLLRELRKKL